MELWCWKSLVEVFGTSMSCSYSGSFCCLLQEAVAVTTAIQEEIFSEMGVGQSFLVPYFLLYFAYSLSFSLKS